MKWATRPRRDRLAQYLVGDSIITSRQLLSDLKPLTVAFNDHTSFFYDIPIG